MSSPRYPLIFQPVLKDYIWGGRALESHLGRSLPDAKNIAESWEIAGHEDGTTRVANGPRRGTLLTDLLAEMGLDLIGRRSEWALERKKFPLLIKLLDANRALSVQVHPNDAYALAHEGNELGKTEMWVILHADPGAEIILGVKPGTTRANFRAALEQGNLEPFLHHIPVKTGDHINVPAGSLHAILGGLLIAEIQQNSNTTYRVYDWNRLGADGHPRPLQVDKALDVINFDQVAPGVSAVFNHRQVEGIDIETLNQTPYFTVERVTLPARSQFNGRCDGESFEIWGVIEGEVALSGGRRSETLRSVQFALLPAAMGPFAAAAKSDSGAVCLRVFA